MNSHEFFTKYLTNKISENPSALAGAGVKAKSIAVEIEGGGQWTLNFDDNGALGIDAGIKSVDCSIHMNEKTWEGLISGSLNVPMAVMMRKIKIKGDTGLAAKVGIAIKQLKA